MRKILFIFGMSLALFLTGCSRKSSKEVDITETSFNVESCDKYFHLLDCILNNDDDKQYSKDDRKELREYIKLMQNGWTGLDEETIDKNCTDELAKFSEMKSELSEIGCSL